MTSSALATQMEPTFLPSPDNVEEVGVRRALLEDLALKTIYVTAPPSLVELASGMRLGYGVVDELFRRLRNDHLTEVTGMIGNAPQFTLTSAGRARALELLSLNQYVGPAPVSLDSYVRQVRRQTVRNIPVHPADIRRAFSELVLEDKTLDKLGAALNSAASIFLHGPTGTGKTAIATTIPRVFFDDYVWIPYALQADGQVITVYDPTLHSKVDHDLTNEDIDQRWVLCRRPTVVVGGELTIEMLELQINPTSRFYSAPVQMKANNGVLVIDDFGRQRVRPEELLNRWIVPLDRGIDFLTLAGGRKIEIPFELFVVFATNLDPSTLADAAFLRRIQTKIKVGTVSRLRFHEIFRRVCAQAGVQYESGVVDALIETIQNKYKEPLRACHPRDMVNQICWSARYENREPRLDWPSLVTAVDAYFVPEPDEEEED
jgi:predicted ATPase with chaperone activity